MAKNVFKPQEIMYLSRKVFIEPPKIVPEEPVEEVHPAEQEEKGGEYTGPSVDDLRREADQFKKDWDTEKERMLAQAQTEGERIRKEAEKVAFEEVKRKNNQAQKIRQDAEDKAQAIIAEAKQKAAELESEIKSRVTQTEREAYQKGYADGLA
ncbi:MAG TPA: flagellar assembly protein FliH, partial [Spirochaetia bacterium]|nr:flagellar assembly protein FliH [Spirochaetia bacterium]